MGTKVDSGLRPGITERKRKPPRWVGPFLTAVERTGGVREAAKWAGVDFTTAYARRKAHPAFAAAWEAALERFRVAKVAAQAAELAAIAQSPSTIGSAANGPPPRDKLGEEFGATQIKRASAERWSEAKERKFFGELVASANVRRAAAAAGVSVQAVYMRRAKTPAFRMRWAQAIENGRAAIETHLVAQAQRAMDPETMDLPASDPRVTISEAIKIAQLNRPSGGGSGTGVGEDQEAMSEERLAELRERLCAKIERLCARQIREDGFTEDPVTGCLIPPGYVRAPD